MLNRNALVRSIVATALLSLVGCGSSRAAPITPNMPAQSGGSPIGTARCQPDFTLALSPTSATITVGQTVKVTIQLASICGLAGTINVGVHGISPPPQWGNGFTIYQPRYDIPLDANSTAVAFVSFGATSKTSKTTYTITTQGKDISGGCCYGLTHSATFILTVN
jgi:hypothetical protein